MTRPTFILALHLSALLGACTMGPPADGDAGSGSDAAAPVANRSEPAAYIRGSHGRLAIELDVVEGLGPRDGVAETMIGALDPLLDKPGGIDVVRDDVLPMDRARAEWSFADVRALGEELFDGIGDADTAVMHTMWLPGRYVVEGGGTVLGVAWGNRHIAIFADAIAGSCGSALPLVRERICREAEAAVWTHEVGHVIGLVNNGIPMLADHEDAEHPGHTNDEDGVMYWAYEGASVVDLLVARMGAGGSGRLFDFGPASIADVEAYR